MDEFELTGILSLTLNWFFLPHFQSFVKKIRLHWRTEKYILFRYFLGWYGMFRLYSIQHLTPLPATSQVKGFWSPPRLGADHKPSIWEDAFPVLFTNSFLKTLPHLIVLSLVSMSGFFGGEINVNMAFILYLQYITFILHGNIYKRYFEDGLFKIICSYNDCHACNYQTVSDNYMYC